MTIHLGLVHRRPAPRAFPKTNSQAYSINALLAPVSPPVPVEAGGAPAEASAAVAGVDGWAAASAAGGPVVVRWGVRASAADFPAADAEAEDAR